MTATINGSVLRRRRIDASLGLHHAALLLGVGTPTLTRIESGDPAATRAINLEAFLRLADAIGCSPADLFCDEPPRGTELDPEPGKVDPDLLIGVLHESPTQVSVKDLAAAFDAKNAEIRAAADQARDLLDGTGLRLGARDDMLFLAPVHQAEVTERITSLERTTVGRFGIDNGQARILKKVLNGKLATGRKSQYTQSTLALLTRLGMVTASPTGHAPSEALTYALDVP